MRGTPFLKEGWIGGLNTIDSPYTVAENETRDCLNVVSLERGAIRKRYGSTEFLEEEIAPELTSLFPVDVGGLDYLLVSNGKEIWSVDNKGKIALIGEGFTAGSKWCFAQAPTTTAVAGQGPVYMVNGVDKPQYWSAAEAKTKVKEWTGVGTSAKLTDGVAPKSLRVFKSETAGFISSDVGLTIKFETEVKVGTLEAVITEAVIETVVNAKEVILAITEEGWSKEFTTVHFMIERAFYENVTSKKHVPNGKYMVFHGNRIWMTGVSDDSSAVWFSELVSVGEGGEQADPSQWPTSNVVRFESSSGYPITGLGTVGPYVGVWKKNATWMIHDINTGANRQLSGTIGCVSHRSIVEGQPGTFFLTADQGIYLTDGSHLHEMSYNIRPTILNINSKQQENAASAYYNNHFYLSFASGASEVPNRTIDYDLQLKSWWLHDLAGNQWALWDPVSGKVGLYLVPPEAKAGVAQGFVPGTYTDRGKNYTGNGVLGAYWISNWEPFAYYIFRHRIKAPFLKKRVRQIFFNGEGQIVPEVFKNFSLGGRQEAAVPDSKEIATSQELPTNFNAASEKWAEGSGTWGLEVEGTEKTWGGEVAVGQARIYSPGVAFAWSVGWGNNSAEPFIVDAFTYMISFRKS